MNYNRTELGGNIGFTSVVDEKFNSCSLRLMMIVPMGDSASDNSIAVNMITDVNSKLNSIAAMNERLSELYGASFASSVAVRGDMQVLSVTAGWLCNRFAIDGEDITGDMLELVTDCLFSPFADENGFDESIFRLSKKEILDIIDSRFNNKREYALVKAREIAFEGEAVQYGGSGTREQVEAVTPKSAYEAYWKLIETAQIEICFVSPENDDRVQEVFREKFAAVGRNSASHTFYAPSPIKSTPVLVEEEFDVRQAKMVMTFKFDTDDIDAVHLMCVIFGGSPVSKLFVNVREKLSLCYYCSCSMSEFKKSAVVDCGVEKGNIEKATAEILNQLDEIRKGNISDEELQSAFLALENSYTSFGDTHSSYISWYSDCFFRNEYISPKEYLERLFEVTKERIAAAAANVRLDSTYHMLNKEAE
ncbi:MAG: insulinase family protein [Ruminococcus sp.]|nr:insulinase family protein [Ruminococcus sp.]